MIIQVSPINHSGTVFNKRWLLFFANLALIAATLSAALSGRELTLSLKTSNKRSFSRESLVLQLDIQTVGLTGFSASSLIC